MKRLVIPAVVVAMLALGALWWVVVRTTAQHAGGDPAAVSPEAASAAARSAARGSAVVALPDVTPHAPANIVPRISPASLALREKIAAALNLRALYEQLRDAPDPTGEISYRLAEAIFECTPFIDKSIDDISKRLSATQPPVEIPRRRELITWMVQRCGGFSGMGSGYADLYQDLHRRAEAAGYPAAVARALRFQGDREQSDATAIRLLTSTADADVLLEIERYLEARNGGAWLRRPGAPDPQTWANAWGMLQCSYGADCGPTSRPVVMTCIVMSYCGLPTVEQAVLAQTRSPAALQSAARLRDLLAARIQERDWAAIGFVPPNNNPP